MDVVWAIVIYLVVMNILGFVTMGADKWKAKHREWRIPENTLFVLAILGGSLGSLIGMYVFRHKTKHWYFVYGLPAILALQIAIAAYLIGSGKIIIM